MKLFPAFLLHVPVTDDLIPHLRHNGIQAVSDISPLPDLLRRCLEPVNRFADSVPPVLRERNFLRNASNLRADRVIIPDSALIFLDFLLPPASFPFRVLIDPGSRDGNIIIRQVFVFHIQESSFGLGGSFPQSRRKLRVLRNPLQLFKGRVSSAPVVFDFLNRNLVKIKPAQLSHGFGGFFRSFFVGYGPCFHHLQDLPLKIPPGLLPGAKVLLKPADSGRILADYFRGIPVLLRHLFNRSRLT